MTRLASIASLSSIDRLRDRLSSLAFENSFLRPGGHLRFGLPQIDRLLPGGGLACGGVHELTGDYAAITVFLAALTSRNPRQQPVLWITPDQQLSASALGRQGLDHRRLTIAWTHRHADRLWAMDQSLRELGYGAVISEFDSMDEADMQRLQAAADRSNGVALVIRRDRQASSIAQSRWHIEAARSDGRLTWLQVSLARSNTGRSGSWLLEWNPAAHSFRILADLAQPLAAAAE